MEQARLAQSTNSKKWKKWGPYLSERQWGTVREDYSPGGNAWTYINHDLARSYAYRWGEEGIGGFCDSDQVLCLAPVFWNGRDSILKERLFGLTNGEGNHGEDVNEIYLTLDSSPTHSFYKYLYKFGWAMHHIGKKDISLWDDQDAFYYDAIQFENGTSQRLRIRSLVGIIPLLAVEIMPKDIFAKLREFNTRLQVIKLTRPDLTRVISDIETMNKEGNYLFAIMVGDRLESLLKRLLDEAEFLSDYGIRSLSKHYQDNPFVFEYQGGEYRIQYEPGESSSDMFGGNSNWRGPIWFPLNYLIINALRKYHQYYGDSYTYEFPARSGNKLTLKQIAMELTKRLLKIFERDETGAYEYHAKYQSQWAEPHFREHHLFYEFFNGDTGQGLGASHQTGWTALIANLLLEMEK